MEHWKEAFFENYYGEKYVLLHPFKVLIKEWFADAARRWRSISCIFQIPTLALEAAGQAAAWKTFFSVISYFKNALLFLGGVSQEFCRSE